MTEKQKKFTQDRIHEQKIICVKRGTIDPESRYTGFPVWLSDSLLLMTNIYDFHDEGYVLLQTADLTEVTAKDSDFYEQICIREGLGEKVSLCPIKKVGSYSEALRQFTNYPGYISIHCENEQDMPQYFLGRIDSLEETGVKFASLGCDGEWDTAPEFILYDKITMLAWDDYYAKMFYHYCK